MAISIILAIALAVAVLVGILGFSEGMQAMLRASGDSLNTVVLRDGSVSETTSVIDEGRANQFANLESTASDAQGRSLVSPERWTYVNEPRRDGSFANIAFRGLTEVGRELRPEVHLSAGRWYTPGKHEIVASQLLSKRFLQTEVGDTLSTGQTPWTVVGLFDAQETAYASEMWTDESDLREVFGQPYATLLVRASNLQGARNFQDRVLRNSQLQLRAVPERRYFAQQGMMPLVLRLIAYLVATLMAVGAVFGLINMTSYFASQHTGKGLSQASMISPIVASVVLAVCGGIIGILFILPFAGRTLATTNWYSFAELLFPLRISSGLMLRGVTFAVCIGLVGGLLPALRASSGIKATSRP
jgi:putative ABC transport system permease protein